MDIVNTATKMEKFCKMESERRAHNEYRKTQVIWRGLALDELISSTAYAICFDLDSAQQFNHVNHARREFRS